jgi:hypothetical protein
VELLTALWLGGVVFYFWKTDERARENHLLLMWCLMLLPTGYWVWRFIAGLLLSPA